MSKGIEISIMRDIVPALFGICRRFAVDNGSKRNRRRLTEVASSGQTLFCAFSRTERLMSFCILAQHLTTDLFCRYN